MKILNGTSHEDIIASTPNLDVITKVANIFKEQKLIQVEASMTEFKHVNNEKIPTQVVKKVTVSAIEGSFDKAQEKALKKAVKLMGLGGTNE